MEREFFKVNVDYRLDYDVFENLIVTALEGGSNYWLDYESRLNPKVKELYPDEPLSIAIAKAVFYNDITIVFTDAENEDETFKLKSKNVEPEVRKMIKKGYSDVFMRWIEGNFDATDADVIFQHIVLRELTFC